MNKTPDNEAMIAALLAKFRQQLEATLPDGDMTPSELKDVAEVLGNGAKQDILEYLKTDAKLDGLELSGGC